MYVLTLSLLWQNHEKSIRISVSRLKGEVKNKVNDSLSKMTLTNYIRLSIGCVKVIIDYFSPTDSHHYKKAIIFSC